MKAKLHRRGLFSLALVLGCTACANTHVPAAPQPISFDANLWQAAREAVAFLPEGVADPVGGTLETGWGEAAAQARDRYKLLITLDYTQPYTSAVGVVVQHEIKSGDGWMQEADDAAAAAKFTQLIVRDAGELRGERKSS